MKKNAFFASLFSLLLIVSSCNDDKKKDTTEVAEQKNEQKFDDNKTEDDREFVVDAASGGLMEVQLGKLAATNASSAKVKEFGAMMVADHTKANTELKALAATKNISIPPAPGEKHQKHIDELSKKTGAEFDKDYMKLMVEDHEEDVSKFDEEANKGKDADVKAFATKTVTVLRTHLEHAKSINDAVKK